MKTLIALTFVLLSSQAFAAYCDDESSFVPGFVSRINAVMDKETVINEANDAAFGITPSAHMKYLTMGIIQSKTFPKAGKKKQIAWSCLNNSSNGNKNIGAKGKAVGLASVEDGVIRIRLSSDLKNTLRDGVAYHESIHAIQFILSNADKRTRGLNDQKIEIGNLLNSSEISNASYSDRIEVLSRNEAYRHNPELYLKAYTNNILCMEYAAHYFEYKYYGKLNKDVSSFPEMDDFLNKGDDSLLIKRLNENYVSHRLGREYTPNELNQAIQMCKDVGFPNSMMVFNKTIELGLNNQLANLLETEEEETHIFASKRDFDNSLNPENLHKQSQYSLI